MIRTISSPTLTQRDETSMRQSAKEAPTTRCLQPQEKPSTSKGFYLCSSTVSQPSYPPTVEGSKAGNTSVPGWRNQDLGWGEACRGWVAELRQGSGLCPLILVPLFPH